MAFFYYKSLFPVETEYYYFSANLSLKTFLWTFLNYSVRISVFQCIWYLDGFKVILKPFCMQILKACFDAHTFLQKMFFSTWHTAFCCFLGSFAVGREKEFCTAWLKHIILLFLQIWKQKKNFSLEIPSSGLFLRYS